VVDSDVYATVHDISYLGPTGERISAYLVAPKRSGPFAAVLSGHWGNGTRAEFLPEAELYARAGAVSMVHGHRRLLSIFATAARQRVQASTLQQGIIRC
jgi:cephalosporin-C deacetylase-like acetyl esterase